MSESRIKKLEEDMSLLSLDLYKLEVNVDEVLDEVTKAIIRLSDKIAEFKASEKEFEIKETGRKQ